MSIQYNLLGTGESKVIVIHDWSQDVTSNDAIKPFLNQQAFTFALADVRGYGKSINLTGKYSATEVVKDVAQLADELGWSEFSLIGHSMTGMVVQRAMIDIPNRLKKVILTTPVPASGMNTDEETYNFFNSMVDDDEAFKAGMDGLTSAKYDSLWTNYKLEKNRQTVNPTAMRAYCDMWAKGDFSNEMKNISTPTLVVCGKHDNENLRLQALKPNFSNWFSNFETIEMESGHYPMQEKPVEYAYIIQKFLASN
ncbi:MAG: alpha/beta hydrolase [Gammaproteobacteria bacterium]|nr:MAG: alpha/beta hydrolase [Gammaproteobacteria bacterium]UTW43378.1 alpha/beta hydrolase [bacterium SCSIO 12844]